MLFGKSVFQSILTRLDEEHVDEAEDKPSVPFRVSGLPMGFVAETVDISQPAEVDGFHRLYETNDEDRASLQTEPPEPAAPIMPDHLTRLTDAEIAADLDLKSNDRPEILMAKRRAFAMLNHPDRVDPQFKAEATRRMTVANMLVDQALRTCSLQRH